MRSEVGMVFLSFFLSLSFQRLSNLLTAFSSCEYIVLALLIKFIVTVIIIVF